MSGETKEVFGSNYGQNDVIINGLIDKMTLFDDNLMSLVFGQNIETTELLLRVIMERDIKVIDVRGQDELKNPVIGGRCITLDVHATDVDGRHIDIEVQINAEGSHVKRARYHSSLIDANVTEPGEKLENLVETYVIFITEHDVLGKGKPIYHIDRVIKETGENFGDEAHILYVNGEYRDESPIGTLMHDFSCTNAKDIKYRTLAERVRYFKEDEKGVAAMCKAMEDMRDEAALAARLAERKEVASRLLKKGAMSFEEIAEISQLSVEEVRALAGKRGA